MPKEIQRKIKRWRRRRVTTTVKTAFSSSHKTTSTHLEREQQHESHHETEKTHGFGQGETQNGVREELLLETRITSITDDQAAENCTDTSSGTGNSDRGGTSTDVLGSRIDIVTDRARVDRRDLKLFYTFQKF